MLSIRAEILRCPWELRDLLADLGNDASHEKVEAVRTVEPGDLDARHDPFWSHRPGEQSIVLWIRISGRFCMNVYEGAPLQHTEITEYLARRHELLKRNDVSL